MTRLRGLIAAAATPLSAERRIDQNKLASHCALLLELGCDGINLLGTTGEATSFSVEERIEAMQSVASAGLPLDRFMVGTGAAALADAVRLTAKARELGFAGALVLPPFYYKGIDVAGLIRYFDALVGTLGARDLRLYLYHFPQSSGVPFSHEAVARLLDRHGDVVLGLKDSSGDLAYSTALARQHPSLAVFPSAEAALSHDDAGFAGCISASLNVTSSIMAEALRQRQTDASAAQSSFDAATAIRAALASVPLVAAVKWALADLQQDPQWRALMPPLRPLTDDEQSALVRTLAPTAYSRLQRVFGDAKPEAVTLR